MKLKGVFIFILIFWVFSACSRSPQLDYWPTDGWRTSTPEEQGVSSAELAEALDAFLGDPNTNIHSFLMIRNGYIIAEYYAPGYDENTLHNLHSATKSFTGTLIGMAEYQGLLDVDDLVFDYFPEYKRSLLEHNSLTIKHLLTMSSGLDANSMGRDQNYNFESVTSGDEEDWTSLFLKGRFKDPGMQFNYNGVNSYLLLALLNRIDSINLETFINEDFFQQLGISDYFWSKDNQGVPIGCIGLHLRPRDMAKLGQLYLSDGLWDGKRLLSSEWVYSASHDYFQDNPDVNYGYQFWIGKNSNWYCAEGFGGQMICVNKNDNVVIVITGHESKTVYEQAIKHDLYKDFWEAYDEMDFVDHKRRENPEGYKKLSALFDRNSELEVEMQSIPDSFYQYVGTEIVFKRKAFNGYIDKIVIKDISTTEMTLDVYYFNTLNEIQKIQYQIGLDNIYRYNDCKELNLYSTPMTRSNTRYHYPDPDLYKYALKATFNDFPVLKDDEISLDIDIRLLGAAKVTNWDMIFRDDIVQLYVKDAYFDFSIYSEPVILTSNSVK